ncbi:zinc ABC transporter ATP-binding protein AztA [Microbacterium marinilacus]|uniref:Zinc ABC transporter ATP-binding protein AztA n=1 Tax=Microbacterium marinilacus TaxID=415209 RepID=A0ABP7BNJ5_9MICO|nr:zinc ABC transporter ATP-binding protein AztA [Microbacterium marinilacus]MBY0688336.1 metal ABC transporter ATP-binding protein [Microbacterium marinilacus]
MPTHRPAILTRSLSFGYGPTDVIADISVHIPYGTVTAIAGPNGAGKSTLLELMAGVLSPRAGTVERAEPPALVVQHPAAPTSLPLTVRDVVELGLWARASSLPATRGARPKHRAAVVSAIHRVGLEGLERRPFADLSGGQRQRALLAQGIVRAPALILLDEPAAGLDAASRSRTRQILAEEAQRGAAVACVTHDPESIAAADRVIRLDSGRAATDPAA